jgi:uncharacterized membrane protein YgdD (TMEM256/DUF423 family)
MSLHAARFRRYRPDMDTEARVAIVAGALLAALGVMLGAFGAHALRDLLDPVRLGWWQTGVQYQMWQAIGLVAIGATRLPRTGAAAAMLVAGTIIFSGSLYLMALTDARWLGAVTPVGGALMIAGWLWLTWRVARRGGLH